MKFIRLTKLEKGIKQDQPNFFYINADNITFLEQSESSSNIYFGHETSHCIKVKESANKIMDIIEKLK